MELPLLGGEIKFGDGTTVKSLDSNLVRVETDLGLDGWGENCPMGANYLPAYAKGTRSGIEQLGPPLIGEDPTNLANINETMDRFLKGHPYVKSPIDIACWDILGKMAALPVSELLGGRFGEKYPLYRIISQDTPEKMAESVRHHQDIGYTAFQLKNGSNYLEDIERIKAVAAILRKGEKLIADANTGWKTHEALTVIHRVSSLAQKVALYIEQPCKTYEECLAVRQHCPLPFILDECVETVQMVTRIYKDGAADSINLKISRIGGLTKARLIRDLCVQLGLPMNIEDTGGGDLATAAITHLAHSTPTPYLFASTDFNSYFNTKSVTSGAPKRVNGKIAAPTRPGLGVVPDLDLLGSPVVVVE